MELLRSPSRCLKWAAISLLLGTLVFVSLEHLIQLKKWSDLYVMNPNLIQAEDREQLDDLYDRRMAIHKDGISTMQTNFKFQLILIVGSILIMMRPKRASTMNWSGIGLAFPARLLQLVLPAGLLLLWLEFGYLFNVLIDNRIILWKIIDVLEPQEFADSIYSARLLLRDRFLLDVWFLAFEKDYIIISEEFGMNIFDRLLLVLFGLFLGLGHGCTLSTICNSYERFATTLRMRKMHIAYVLTAVFFILLSHFQFHYTARHDNWLQYVILGSGILFTWLLAQKVRESDLEGNGTPPYAPH